MLGGVRLLVSGPELVDEICDDARFDKKIGGGLSVLQRGPAGAGLFTAETDDPLWVRAHNVLMTPFSLQAMRDYMPKMLDVADQLMDKWSRLNPGEEVDVAADMTRLTLDTIALCGFGYRFNSFYRESPHPFVDAMVRVLTEAQARVRQLPIQTRLRVRAQRQFEEDEAFMNDLVDRIIAERRAEGAAGDTTDLLGRMITGVDKDGEHLPDENIRAQCITFLIAGHETTSGLLSFAIYYLMKHPDVLARARAEVDEVFGDTAAPTFEQVHRLRYVRQILDETLRLWPTAPGFNRTPYEDTVIGGKYAIAAGTPMTVISQALHHSTEVWGPDAVEFNPDHTAAERMTAIPPNAYKPFGTGQRACIGRQFAIQEAVLVLGMLVQRFDFVDHLDYELKTKTTLTVKPDELRIQVQPRPGFQLDRTEPVAAQAPSLPDGRTRAARRPARHPVVGAVRLEPRHGRGHRHPTRPGGHRARVRRHAGGARRARRRPPPRRRPARGVLVVQRHPAGQRRRLLHEDPGGRGRRLQRVRLREHRVGVDLPGRAHPDRRRARRARRPPRPAARRGQRRRRLRRRLPRLARGHLGRCRGRARAARRRRRSSPDRTAPRDHVDQPAGHQPGDHVVPGAARARAGQPRADPQRERQARRAVHAPRGDRAARRHVVPGGRSPRGVAAQRDRPHPPGDGPVRARRRAVPHDHPEQRQPHPPAHRRARAAARGAGQLRRAAGRRDPRRHRHPRRLHRRPGAAGRAARARRRLRRRGARDQPFAAGSPGGVPGVRRAVRGVPRHAPAAAAPLLLDLVVADGG